MMAVNPMAAHCPYDVGDILHTANAASPSDRWPGTEWAAITTFLLGASPEHPAGTTGGEETHTLTVDEMPAHQHTLNLPYALTAGGTQDGYTIGPFHGTANPRSTTSTGNGTPHNNMPPYTTVYIWQRTA